MNFDEQIAKELGVECAILLSNIQFWIKKNMANAEQSHYHEEKWWTYNTAGSFQKLFPYWTQRSIYNYLEKLEKAGYIQSGNFNKYKYDRTKWYTLGEKLLINPICKKVEMDLPKITNASAKSEIAFTENCEPIPDINTDKKQTDINTYVSNDWQAIVLYFYNKISPSTPPKSRFRNTTKEAALHLLTLHSREVIEAKVDTLASNQNDVKYISRFEVFCNKFDTLSSPKPAIETAYFSSKSQTSNDEPSYGEW